MRILQVTPYYENAWAYGGIPRVVGTLARELARRGHQVTVCTTDARDEHTRLRDRERQVQRPTLHVFSNLSNRLAYDFQLFLPRGMATWLSQTASQFDVGHLHGCHHLPGVFAARRLTSARVPYVLTTHGTARRIERRRLAKWLFDHSVGRAVLPGANRVVAVSQAEVSVLERMGADNVRLIPNPLALEEFSVPRAGGRLRERLGLSQDQPVILFLGKISPRKGLLTLARAFAALRYSSAVLVVAGNDLGGGVEFSKLINALSLQRSVHRVGLLEGHERLEALADANLLVYPSTDEVFGLVPLEALLCGTPVVVCGDSGCGEIIASVGGGRVVPANDPQALAHAISALLADAPSARRDAVIAQAAIQARFGAEVVCDQYERLYRELAA